MSLPRAPFAVVKPDSPQEPPTQAGHSETHQMALCSPISHASRIAAACVLPFPTPGPSARRNPGLSPLALRTEWQPPIASRASICSWERTPERERRRGIEGE
eukprot:scaffold321831_cov26-Tisochrysis_lutea.AAC.1